MSGPAPNLGLPQCYVEIYPFEGGVVSPAPVQLMSVRVKNSTRLSGSFEVILAPGGPNGMTGPGWEQIITPMSFVLIGMRVRGVSRIVMAGVARAILTEQDWTGQDGKVRRITTLVGSDFSAYFDSFNWHSLAFTGMTAGSAVGAALGVPSASIPEQLASGLIGGSSSSQSNPAVIGKKWYDEVMAGPNQGILGRTYIPYQKGGKVLFYDAVATRFEAYGKEYIPMFSYFLTQEGAWSTKFRRIFCFPWYEWFITTAGNLDYGVEAGDESSSEGYDFKMQSMPEAPPVSPIMVARVNPIPRLTGKLAQPFQPISITGIERKAWDGLPLVTMKGSPFGFGKTDVVFSAEEVRNFYLIQPRFFKDTLQNGNNTSPFVFNFCGAVDVASVRRYGYRPEITDTDWYAEASDPQDPLGFVQSLATLSGHVWSWFEPLPLMANGNITIPLHPEILPGTKFEYIPFKDGIYWTFYVDTVEHTWAIGTLSTTALTLSRGLPSSIYGNNKFLQAALTGNMQRVAGLYELGLPKDGGQGLTPFSANDDLQKLLGDIAGIYFKPQSNTPS